MTLGILAGDCILVHSSLRSLGYVEGGAEAVVDALLDVLGPRGTLCVPSFVFSLTNQPQPIFDPAHTPSEMGAISEAARRRPGARRSTHLIHSISALGPAAEEITRVHGPSAWACDGPFWQLHHYDAKIVLLGVPYLRCTYFHVVEQLVQTPKRVFREIDAQMRWPDGSLTALPTRAFVPTPGWRNNDFNKFGALLELRGLVRVGPVRNAVTRVLRVRDVVEHGLKRLSPGPRPLQLDRSALHAAARRRDGRRPVCREVGLRSSEVVQGFRRCARARVTAPTPHRRSPFQQAPGSVRTRDCHHPCAVADEWLGSHTVGWEQSA